MYERIKRSNKRRRKADIVCFSFVAFFPRSVYNGGMLKFKIVAVGDMKEKYFRDAAEEYVKRLGKWAKTDIEEVKEASLAADENKKREAEGKEILKRTKGFVILSDVKGKKVSSESFARMIEKCCLEGQSEITFVIGGSNGVSEEVKAAANEIISFGDITLPHRLFRVVLIEQIYRAETIINGISYHK